ncbi:MAG TPA: pyridoxamine 5'-phosphate oxidase family protein [Gemmatimonadaceae bacterium]|nr:pyridoxamine 5'-phosphate oxidase family protein [Gemmatimonadaceae bacterium]
MPGVAVGNSLTNIGRGPTALRSLNQHIDAMTTTPTFSALSASECNEVLARNHVGRLAFQNGPWVDIRPVGFVAQGQWIFLRTAPGEKLTATGQLPHVAFEVDEVDGPFDWRSVVVHGSFHLLPDDGSPIERRELARAVDALREVMPQAFTAADPVPERDVVCGINIHKMSGRAATSG